MGTNTYANNYEICSKSSSGKTVAAMPDPCFTPPPTPAGVEVVVPYPNTAMASDLDKGSAKVLICNKMAALEKDSYMKTSMGDEAAKPSSMQGGVITKTTKGKVYFTNWSQDVKFEGKGVARHVDATTHNHGSTPGHCVPMSFLSDMTTPGKCEDATASIVAECKAPKNENTTSPSFNIPKTPCAGLELLPTKKNLSEITVGEYDSKYIENVHSQSENGKNMAKAAASMSTAVNKSPCLQALRCALQSYKDTKNTPANAKSKEITCCKGQSGHHVVPRTMAKAYCYNYDNNNPAYANAPVVCVEGVNNTHGTHGMIHRNLKRKLEGKKEITCKEMFEMAAASMKTTFDNCSKDCVEQQLKEARNEKRNCDCGKEEKPFAASAGFSGDVDINAVEGAKINSDLLNALKK